MILLLTLLALLGHAFLWIGLVNRLHSVGIRRRIIKRTTLVFFCCAAAIPVVIGVWAWKTSGDDNLRPVVVTYAIVCWTIAAVTLLRWTWLRCLTARTPAIVRFHGVRRYCGAGVSPADRETCRRDARTTITPRTAENRHHFLTRLPFNEVMQLEVNDWMLDVPRLPAALDGLAIVHLSDFHFTGRVGKAYFREVVRTANALKPDIVAVTGDIIDAAECLDWIPEIFGQLAAPHGVYFVLGNHDLRVGDVGRVRGAMIESGAIDLGGREREIAIAGNRVLLAGNERPWIGTKQEDRHSCLSKQEDRHSCLSKQEDRHSCLSKTSRPTHKMTDRNVCPPDNSVLPACPPDAALRLALAHSPDQLPWARAWNADLMLVGHTHGGQIRIPPLGAIFSPSARGVRHVSGIYHAPPTILHVSRGVSGDIPLRWNCRPEISRLRLRR